MRSVFVIVSALALAACGEKPAHEYPAEAHASFSQGCPAGDPRCDCMWDKITRTMTYEEYDAAMSRFTSEGLMDPRLTEAKVECHEKK